MQNFRRLARGHLGERQEVAHRAEHFFRIRSGLPDHFGIEADSGELDEVFVVGPWEIDQARTARFDHLPGLGKIVLRNTQFGGEDVHRADREDAKMNVGASDAIDYFVDCSVATGGNNRAIPLVHRAGGKASSVAGEPVLRTTTWCESDAILSRKALARSPRAAGFKMTRILCFLFTLHIPEKFRSFPACSFLPSVFFLSRPVSLLGRARAPLRQSLFAIRWRSTAHP